MPAATDQFDHALFDAAQRYLAAGLSLIPVSRATKQPREDLLPFDPDLGRGSWKPYQTTLPTLAELRRWIEHGAQIAVVCGQVSGGLLVIDFDAPGFFGAWELAVGSLADGLPVQRTGGGGTQVFVRCPQPGQNDKLAWTPDDTADSGRTIAIETRGEGGYAIVAPSLHPSGKHYKLINGDFAQIPTVSQAHADALLAAARKLDEAPYTRQQLDAMQAAMNRTSQHRQTLNGSGQVIDAYNAAVSIDEALRAYGYVQVTRERYARPGGVNASVTIKDGRSYHHNTNDPLCDGNAHDAFDLYTFYAHKGDAKAAARAAATLLCLPPLVSQQQPSSYTTVIASQGAAQQPQALDPVLVDANLTDTGNAECLAALYGDRLRYCHTRRQWLLWSGQHWQADENGAAQRLAIDIARQRYLAGAGIANHDQRSRHARWSIQSESLSKINAALGAASILERFTTVISLYDTNPWLAGTSSGTLNLQQGQVHSPERADYLTQQLGVAYDQQATCPRWLTFLDEIFGGDSELIGYIQRAVGYSLTGDTREQKLFLCFGHGANGKSKFLDVLSALLGDYAANASFATFDADRRNEATNDLAMLRGKRLVTIIESNEDRRLDEAKVKAVTGGDLITCRFLHKEFFSYRPQFKIWFAMNHKPIIRGMDRGIWRRIVLIPFTQNFEGPRDDKQLLSKLLAELPGVLNWALDGLRAWQQQGLGSARVIDEATASYQAESDELGAWLTEETIGQPDHWLVASEGFSAYKAWAEKRGTRPFTQTSWGRSLGERGYTSERRTVDGKRVTVYLGLRLRVDGDPDSDGVRPGSQPPTPTPAPEPSTVPASLPTVLDLTDDWQEVADGQAVPAGADIKMDLDAGKTYARRLPAKAEPRTKNQEPATENRAPPAADEHDQHRIEDIKQFIQLKRKRSDVKKAIGRIRSKALREHWQVWFARVEAGEIRIEELPT